MNLVPAWYNRQFVEGMNDSRISVALSAEHEPMNYEDPLYSRETATPIIGRRNLRLRIIS